MEMEVDRLSKKLKEHKEILATEEAAKTALVLPFIAALGYDFTDPSEVVPEYTCDVPTKKGEKVDYAICVDGSVRMLIECKGVNQSLSLKHAGQLYRYFSVSDAKFAILTNGCRYLFYSDLDATNRMDAKPFFEFDLSDVRKSDFKTLSRFHRDNFDIDAILEVASSLQLEGTVRAALEEEFESPSDELVRLVASKAVDGRLTPGVKNSVKRHITNSIRAIINDSIGRRLSAAIDDPAEDEPVSEIDTTSEEIEGFQIVRAICAGEVDPERIVMRDAKSYCAILLDDNNRKTIARLWFNSTTTKYLGVFDGKDETRHLIARPSDIYKMREQIVSQVKVLKG